MKCIALVGGIGRLEHHYKDLASGLGVELEVFNTAKDRMASRIKGSDAVVILTNKASHTQKSEAVKAAKSRDIPVLFRHSCGICTLRECLLEWLESGKLCCPKTQGPRGNKGLQSRSLGSVVGQHR